MRELKAHRLQKQINELVKELREHQEKCKHIKGTKIPGSNTGNYDPHEDCYWYDCYCPTCLKTWFIRDTDPGYYDCKLKTVSQHKYIEIL